MTDKKVYSDEKIFAFAQGVVHYHYNEFADMLQQLMNERNALRDSVQAILEDLKALEAEVEHAMSSMDIEGWMDLVDLTRSEKYEKGETA